MNTTFLPLYRKAQTPEQTHFCPGCGHGTILKYADEAICAMGAAERTVWVSPVGCGGLNDAYLSVSHVLAAHGRASAAASAIKRLCPESLVIVSQGDGDLASIGIAEAVHAANRGENITVFFINNANFAMTGGQMAPTTLIGQMTPTTPQGRSCADHGAPIRMCELLSTLDGPAYIARVCIGRKPAQLLDVKRAIRYALENQAAGRGYSFVEILSPCPANWHCSPQKARERMDKMCETFPLGVFRDESREKWCSDRQIVSDYSVESSRSAFNALASPVRAADVPVLRIHQNNQNYGTDADWTRPISVCCAGFGGQGILTLGRLIARLALVSGLNATWIPSYGPEMRGGAANCFVRISDEAIDSPAVDYPDILFVLNQPAMNKYLPRMSTGGHVFWDCSAVSEPESVPAGVSMHKVPAADIADRFHLPKCVNIVMLGAFCSLFHCSPDDAANVLDLPENMRIILRKGAEF